MTIKIVAFDADDTLWHNESLFVETRTMFANLLSKYRDPKWVQEHLDATEVQNLERYGYGIKAFTLSMIETALSISENRLSAADVKEIIGYGQSMLASPVELLDGVSETISHLQGKYDLHLITKGDLFDQESKIAQSGLGEAFQHVEVVSRKNRHTYESSIARAGVRPAEFAMVGNSLKSDVIPAAAAGAYAIHVPYPTVWPHEDLTTQHASRYSYHEIQNLPELPALLARLDA